MINRKVDTQYRNVLQTILDTGISANNTPQGIPALTSFEAPKMSFKLSEGFPLITERSMLSFWKKPIDELFYFIRGGTTYSGLAEAGCGWWDQWKPNSIRMGLGEDSLGPASYGAAFANFPMPDGGTFNQFEHVIDQLKHHPGARTHIIISWIPFWLQREKDFRAVIAPCHGICQFRVIDEKLILHMMQRSADVPVGVPANMVQYSALLLAMADLLGLEPYQYVHTLSDAHIYMDQMDNMKKILEREPRPLPAMKLTKKVTDLFEVDSSWFEISDYNPHPGMKIPVAT